MNELTYPMNEPFRQMWQVWPRAGCTYPDTPTTTQPRLSSTPESTTQRFPEGNGK